MTQDRLIAEMDQRLRLMGAVNTWTMPIKNRTDMLSTGVRTTLAVKIFGPDLEIIQRIGQDIERALAPLPGTASVYAERSFGGRYLDIRPDADALARYGLTTGDAQEVISLALGGEERSEEHTSELQSRRDLVCRLLLEKKKKKKRKVK